MAWKLEPFSDVEADTITDFFCWRRKAFFNILCTTWISYTVNCSLKFSKCYSTFWTVKSVHCMMLYKISTAGIISSVNSDNWHDLSLETVPFTWLVFSLHFPSYKIYKNSIYLVQQKIVLAIQSKLINSFNIKKKKQGCHSKNKVATLWVKKLSWVTLSWDETLFSQFDLILCSFY